MLALIPFPINKFTFERVKAPGFNDHNRVNIINMDPVMIIESRELSRSSNVNLFIGNGINSTQARQHFPELINEAA